MISNVSNIPAPGGETTTRVSHRALWRAAEQFESIFVNQLLGQMESSSLGPDGLSGPGSDIYRGMLNQRLAGKMATQDPFGIARLLVDQIGGYGDRQPEASRAKGCAAGEVAGQVPMATHSVARRFSAALLPLLKKAAGELHVSPRILLAQAALETGWGQHVPRTERGTSTHNVFGVKSGPSWPGPSVRATTHEYRGGTAKAIDARFRVYGSFSDAIHDFVKVARAILDRLPNDGGVTARRWGQLLMRGGYATDPQYAEKLQAVASSHLMDAAIAEANKPSSTVANVPYNTVSPR